MVGWGLGFLVLIAALVWLIISISHRLSRIKDVLDRILLTIEEAREKSLEGVKDHNGRLELIWRELEYFNSDKREREAMDAEDDIKSGNYKPR